MARSYRPVERGQQFLLPPDMAEWLPQGHLAWFILDVVAQLDTSVFHERHPMVGPGRAAYDPDMLLALLLYGYAVGERSSRRIERLCVDHVAFRVICAGDVPDHTTIARFRAVHQDVFAALFTQVLVLCARAGMGRVGVVSLDGTKIAANASAGANRSEDWLRAEVERILAEAAAVDEAEDDQFGDARGDELPPELADPGSRVGRIRQCLDQIRAERNRAAQANQAERERAEEYLRRVEGGEAPMGPVPKAADPIRVARARLARERARQRDEADRQRRNDAAKAARRAQAALERAEADAARAAEPGRDDPASRPSSGAPSGRLGNVSDPDSRLMPTRGGWIQGYNAQVVVSDDHLILATGLTQDTTDTASFEPMMAAAVDAADIVTTLQPISEDEQPAAGIGTILADAGYLSIHNLTADGPDRLIALGKQQQLHREARDRPASGPAPPDVGPVQQMGHRLRTPHGEQTYRRRGATVETVIAHLKDQVGLRQFSRRGLQAAASELNLAATAVNLLKLHNLASVGVT
jgi:transposase